MSRIVNVSCFSEGRERHSSTDVGKENNCCSNFKKEAFGDGASLDKNRVKL